MKKIILALSIISLLVLDIRAAGKEKSVKYNPEKPKAGDEISISFNAEGTQLDGSNNVQICFSLYSFKSKYAEHVECTHVWKMEKDEKLWKTKFKTSDETNLVLVKFFDNDLIDNNDGLGYIIKINDAGGNETIYSDLGIASAYTSWGRYLNYMEPNYQKGYELFNKVFSVLPSLKNEYLGNYLMSINKITPDAIKIEAIKSELEKIENSSELTGNNYATLISYYKNIKMDDKAKELEEKSIKLFPDGPAANSKAWDELDSEKDVNKIIALAAKMEKDFPSADPYAVPPKMEAFANLVKLSAYEKLSDLWESISSQSNKAIAYNWLAERLVGVNKELELALKIIKRGEEACILEEKYPTQSNFRIRPEEWLYKSLNGEKYYVFVTYGKILKLLNRKEEAIKKYETALLLDVENMYERDEYSEYFKLALELKDYSIAQQVAEKCIKKGIVLNELDEVLKQAYIKKNNTESGFNDYINTLKESGKQAAIERQKKKMINLPAPQFTLSDIDGKKVSLADYNGKVVVLDFWATWCGPCKASFPAMQKTIEKYKNDSDVVFLFVNTWQTEIDKKKNAEDFIKETKYTFHILLDVENKVVADYKVSGIPTKFVIGKNGNIRFNVTGSEIGDVAVQNLSTMIELAGK